MDNTCIALNVIKDGTSFLDYSLNRLGELSNPVSKGVFTFSPHSSVEISVLSTMLDSIFESNTELWRQRLSEFISAKQAASLRVLEYLVNDCKHFGKFVTFKAGHTYYENR